MSSSYQPLDGANRWCSLFEREMELSPDVAASGVEPQITIAGLGSRSHARGDGAGTNHAARHVVVNAGLLPPDMAWREDVALEMWVTVEQDIARIQLAGSLDWQTAPKLFSVVKELISDGIFCVEVEGQQLRPSCEGGINALAELQGITESSGVRLIWKWPENASAASGPDCPSR